MNAPNSQRKWNEIFKFDNSIKVHDKKNVNSFVNIMTDVDKAVPGSWNNQASKMI